MPSPNAGSGTNALTAVAAVGPGDVWVAGYYDDNLVHRSVVFHWDGGEWSRERLPKLPGQGDALNGIATASRDRVVAVGGYSMPNSTSLPLILAYQGGRWRQTASPVAFPGSSFSGVAAIGAQAWAVGAARGLRGDRSIAIGDVGDGWRPVGSQRVGSISEDLNGVVADGGDAWAVGSSFSGGLYRTLVERFDAGRWSPVATPNVPGTDDRLLSVAMQSGEVWAVGSAVGGAGPGRTLVLHGCEG